MRHLRTGFALLVSLLSAGLLASAASMASAQAEPDATPRLIGSYTWVTPAIVGLSGLELSADGTRFAAVSDRGWYVTGQFTRADDSITGVTIDSLLPIRAPDGLPVAARRERDLQDAEALALSPDGRLWIAFERDTRVQAHAAPDQPGVTLPGHPGFARMPFNRQLEALAVNAEGTLFALPESPSAGGFTLYQQRGDGWVIAGQIPAPDDFAITGADFDDSGQLWVLERRLAMGVLWQSRIRRVDPAAPHRARIVWTSLPGAFRNLEGIAWWRDSGGPRLTLVSDDNANALEPTQFVELRIGTTP